MKRTVRNWFQIRKEEFKPIRELRNKIKGKLDELAKRELHQREDDFFKNKLELGRKKAEEEMARPQAVKLQKYTIIPFKGDCKDWLRFWNRYVVEVDSLKISKMSKFNSPRVMCDDVMLFLVTSNET